VHLGNFNEVLRIQEDSWTNLSWYDGDWVGYRALVDYFVPVRLDRKDDEMDGYSYIDLFMVQDDKTGRVAIQQRQDGGEILELVTERSSFLPLSKKYLETQGYEVTRKEPESKFNIENRVIEHRRKYRTLYRNEDDFYWLRILTEEFAELVLSLEGKHNHTPDLELTEIAGICINWLEKRAGNNQAKVCEPEIKACPYCKSPKLGCKVFRGEVSGMGVKSWIECVDECGYQSAYFDTDEEAIESHNFVADNALPRKGE
jgi:hypothetical protein